MGLTVTTKMGTECSVIQCSREEPSSPSSIADSNTQQTTQPDGIPPHPPLKGPSNVNMLKDRVNPPSDFSHADWCQLRDQLYALGHASAQEGNDARSKLKRVALAMNLAQELYGNAVSLLGHQCGRLFTERAAYFLLGMEEGSRRESLFTRLKQFKEEGSVYGPAPIQVCDDLLTLKDYGNCVDHETSSSPNLAASQKPDIVHRVFRVATYLEHIALKPCMFGERCDFGAARCPFRHQQTAAKPTG